MNLDQLLTLSWTVERETPFASWGTLQSGSSQQGWRSTTVSHEDVYTIHLLPFVGCAVCAVVLASIYRLVKKVLGRVE